MEVQIGKSYIFNTDDSDMIDYNGDEAFVIGHDVFGGVDMYRVCFANGYVTGSILEEELTDF